MSILKNFPAVPNRIAIVFHFMQGYPNGLKEDELKGLLSPRSLKNRIGDDDIEIIGKSMADDVVHEAITLGILENMDENTLCIAKSLKEIDDTMLLHHLEKVLIEPDQANKIGQGQFPLALAWLLSQNPLEPLEFSNNYHGQIEEDCGSDVGNEISNTSCFQNLVYWSQYLGYVWRLKIDNRDMVVPDPTLALERHLPNILAKSGEASFPWLIKTLAEKVPVMDNGIIRMKVGYSKGRIENSLSKSTTIALLRLEERGVIALKQRSDAPAVILSTGRPVSHIILQNGG